MDRLDFLRQEIAEGADRKPPMPPVQIAAHIRELKLLEVEFGL